MHAVRLIAMLAVAGAALCAVSPARADDGSNRVYGFIVDLRQSATDTGRRALGHAESVLSRLELGIGDGHELRVGIGLGGETPSRAPAVALSSAAAAPQKRLSLGDVASVTPSDHSWSLDRARANLGAEIGSLATDPATYLTGNVYRGPNTGAALAEHAYEGRDIELGLPLGPDLRAAVAHYWWGERAFSPTVDGYRFSLRYDLSKNLQFEGGNTQDNLRSSAGFLGIRFSKPLGLDRPPGVMPLVTPADK